MLFFGVVEQQPELHALAGKFPIGQRAHAGQHGADAGLRIGGHGLGSLTFRRPGGNHLLQVGDQQFGCSLQIGCAPVAITIGAIGGGSKSVWDRLPAPASVPLRSWPQSRNSIAW
jgi:hypothetical protein